VIQRLEEARAIILWGEHTIADVRRKVIHTVEFDAAYVEGTLVQPEFPPHHVNNSLLLDALHYLPEVRQLELGMTMVDDVGLREIHWDSNRHFGRVGGRGKTSRHNEWHAHIIYVPHIL